MDFEKVIAYAAEQGCSDVHITPELPIYIRKNTLMQAVGEPVYAQQVQELLSNIMPDEAKAELQQKRQTDFMYRTPSGIRLRGNAFFQDKGMAVCFRVIKSEIMPVEELNFPEFMLDKVRSLKQGLVLIVGPTGQGKSTTLASFLRHRAENQTEHILTIEDPIEYILPSGQSIVQQREVGRDVHSFQDGIKAALREDPDVIMVGEMRDRETIESTLTLAETGHTVFATLHTSSGTQTISRIIDVFPGDEQEQIRSQLASTLTMVIAQRLLPKADGSGLALAYEILVNNYAIQNYIRQNKIFQIPNAFQSDDTGQMIQLEQSIAGLVLNGVVTPEVGYEYARRPEQLRAILQANGIS